MTKSHEKDIAARSEHIAANIVDDFREPGDPAREMSRDQQVAVVSKAIADLVAEFYEQGFTAGYNMACDLDDADRDRDGR